MSVAAKIWMAMKLDMASTIRKAAAVALYDYWMELHRHGRFLPYEKQISRIQTRFKLGDWVCALSAHYPLPNK